MNELINKYKMKRLFIFRDFEELQRFLKVADKLRLRWQSGDKATRIDWAEKLNRTPEKCYIFIAENGYLVYGTFERQVTHLKEIYGDTFVRYYRGLKNESKS